GFYIFNGKIFGHLGWQSVYFNFCFFPSLTGQTEKRKLGLPRFVGSHSKGSRFPPSSPSTSINALTHIVLALISSCSLWVALTAIVLAVAAQAVFASDAAPSTTTTSAPTATNSSAPAATTAPDSGSFIAGSNPLHDAVSLFVFQALLIIALARLLYIPISYLRQPRVIAEVLGGIILGRTGLSRIAGFKTNIFPDSNTSHLDLVAQFGLMFFLFLVGLELDPSYFIRDLRKSTPIAMAGLIVPFLSSFGLAAVLFNNYQDSSTDSFGAFGVFIAAILSLTTFPDIARIMTGAKAANHRVRPDSWTVLLFVISLDNNVSTPQTAAYIFLVMIAYASFLWFAIRPVLVHWADRSSSSGSVSQLVVFLVLTLVIASSFFTEAIGANALFGGFLIGAIVPHNHSFAVDLLEKLEDLVNIFFMPLYFFYAGYHADLTVLNDGTAWGMIVFALVIGSLGKLLGAGLAAKFANNMPWRESAAVGIIMNTKGLVEFIVLNLGFQAKIISTTVYAILIVAILLSNFVTLPLLAVVFPSTSHPVAKSPELHATETHAAPTDKSATDAKLVPPAQSSTGHNFLTYLPNMEAVPAMMVFTEMMRLSQLPLSMKALRLIRLSERNSTVLIATDTDTTLKTDPVASVFRAFGQLTGVEVETALAISNFEEFPEQIVAAAGDANLIVLPWRDSIGSDHHAIEEGLRNALIEKVQRSAPCSVAVFIDRGFGADIPKPHESGAVQTLLPPKQKTHHIFFPFTGGRDDREALELVVLLAKSNVDVTILWIHLPADHVEGPATDGDNIVALGASSTTLDSGKAAERLAAVTDSDFVLGAMERIRAAGCLSARLVEVKSSAAAHAITEAYGAAGAGTSVDMVVVGSRLYHSNVAVAGWVDKDVEGSVLMVQGHDDVSFAL
ncbi:Sodium/hydrogen exchanger family-domain-containing protein, partial [Zopfochytrium polystomum]